MKRNQLGRRKLRARQNLEKETDEVIEGNEKKKSKWTVLLKYHQRTKRRRLKPSPAKNNEMPRLELPWAWQPTDS